MGEKITYHPPVLVIVTGIPGSGKTTLSLGLFESYGTKVAGGVLDRIQAVYVDKDMINDGFTNERSGDLYTMVREGTYKAIDSIARKNLELGNSVWIDATYSTEVGTPEWVDRYREIAERTGSKLKLIRCVASEKAIRPRLERRGYQRDERKLENWEAFLEAEPIRVDISCHGIEINGESPLEQNIETVLKFLQE